MPVRERQEIQTMSRLAPMKGITAYFQTAFRADFIAGLTVAMIALPQGMAYAIIAGVPPIYGLYTAILPAIFGALFGSSRHLITGPTNSVALVVAGTLAGVATRTDAVEIVFAVALVSGAIKFALGALRLGGIIRFVSNSVLTGFLTGASLLILLNQTSNLLGLPRVTATDVPLIALELARNLPQWNPFVAIIALTTMLVLIACRRINPNLPAPLLALVAATLVAQLFGGSAHNVTLIRDIGAMTDAVFGLHVPQVALDPGTLQLLLVSGGAIALLGLVEATSVAKSIALATGQTIDASREFVGQGLASLASGLSQGIPSSGSLARSAVNFSSGARTRIAGAFSGGFVLLALLAFAPWLGSIPMAGLAGVVVVAAVKMIDVEHIKLTWQSRVTSRATFLVTFIATLVLPLHYAIYLGVLLSIGLYLYESSNVQLSYLIERDGKFIEKSYAELLEHPAPIALIHVEGALYFGATDDLEARLDALFRSGIRVAILRLRRVRLLGSTGVTAFERIAASAKRHGTRVLLCGVRDQVAETLDASGASALFGAENIFKADDALFDSALAALRRAKELVASSS
ncbi:MAG: SulP family inorganic anion transporter [Chloroflexi bacterium]|nr:SulP family inorganic anion transporter [Chloroflexota bacterium]